MDTAFRICDFCSEKKNCTIDFGSSSIGCNRHILVKYSCHILWSKFEKYWTPDIHYLTNDFWGCFFLHLSYYPHKLRDSVSPVCGIFSQDLKHKSANFSGFYFQAEWQYSLICFKDVPIELNHRKIYFPKLPQAWADITVQI